MGPITSKILAPVPSKSWPLYQNLAQLTSQIKPNKIKIKTKWAQTTTNHKPTKFNKNFTKIILKIWLPPHTQVHAWAHFILRSWPKKKKKKTSKDKRESKTKKTKRETGREFYKLTHEAKKITPHIWLEGEGWGVDSVE